MTQDDALRLMEDLASGLDKSHARSSDLIASIAAIIASPDNRLGPESVEALIRIGAILCKFQSGQENAREDVAATMKESLDKERAEGPPSGFAGNRR